jgi:D-xylose transport system ATP-binding protein
MDAPRPALLEIQNLSKSFGSINALSEINLTINTGQVVAVVGDNGAGKSTLVKAISGSQPPDSGRFMSDGREVSVTSPQDATALGISTIYQDLALCGNLDVVNNLFLGREIAAKGWLNEIEMERQALEIMKTLSVTTIESLRTTVSKLSGGQRQAVAIARVILGTPRIILLDEPTAALGVAQTEQVLRLIAKLRDRGMGVILISHNLSDVFTVSDRIEVLRLGRKAGSFRTPDCSRADIIAAIMGGRRDSGLSRE